MVQTAPNREMLNICIISIIFSVLSIILFWSNEIGLSAILFAIPFFICVVYLLNKNKKIKNKKALILLVPIVLLSLSYVMYNNEFFKKINIVVIPVLTVIMLLEALNDKFEFNNLISTVVFSIIDPLRSIDETYSNIKESIVGFFNKGKKEQKKEGKGSIIKGIIITGFLAGVIIILLCTADSNFARIFRNLLADVLLWFHRLTMWNFVAKVIVAVCIFSYLASFLRYLIYKYDGIDDVKEKEDSKDNLTIKMVLTVLNLVYLLFVAVQVKVIISIWGTDVNFANYARQGFFQLMIVSLINLVTILVAKKKEGEKPKYIRLSSIVMLGFTLVLVVCAWLRMYSYESEYGYTIKRLLVYVALGTEVICLVPTAFYIIGKKLNLAKIYFVNVLTIYVVINMINLNGIIATRNVNRYFETGKLDYVYLRELGTDAVPQMIEVLESDDLIEESQSITEGAKDYIASRFVTLSEELENIDFREWSFSKYFAKRKMADVDFEKYITSTYGQTDYSYDTTYDTYETTETNTVTNITEEFLNSSIYYKSGTITKVEDSKIYFKNKDEKEYILEDNEKNNYLNGRTSEELSFDIIQAGDCVRLEENCKCYIFRNITGDELYEELLISLSLPDEANMPRTSVEDIVSVQQLGNNEAIVKFQISDIIDSYNFPDVNDEERTFEIEVKFTNNTEYHSKGNYAYDAETIENSKYTMLLIRLDKDTLDYKYPEVLRFDSSDS